MKYRMLRKNERPDKAKGDQYRTPSVKRDLWHATSLRGKRTVSECNRAGNPCVYRRGRQRRASNCGAERR